jgi:gluconolactonase
MEFDMAAPGFERILPRESELEVIAHDLYFGEGPVWNKRTGELFWVDIIGDTIWKRTPGAGRQVVMRPSYKADGMTFDKEGRLVVAGWSWRRVWRMELDGSITTLCSQWEGKKLNTPNDIVVKSDGSIYFTDPSGALFNVQMHGEDVQRYLDFHGVFRISPSGETTLAIEDCVYPNGLAFSPDESLLYVNDTRQNLIRVWDVQPDGVSRTA